MSFLRYKQYKDSGVEWLGEVPEGWQVKRLGYFFIERREKVSDKDFEPLSVTKNGVVPQLDTAAKTDDGDNRKMVCTGDFVINSRSDRKGSSGMSPMDGSVSLINTVIQPYEEIDVRFAHHLLRSYPFQEEYYRYGKGIVADLWSTNYSEMRNITLAVPPLSEQQNIAFFLGCETSKIDELVAEQERLIGLLKEKRQAVVSHVVTKGLNPDAPMKDSEIEWLGEVPAHWTISRLGYFASIENGTTPSRENENFWNDGTVPWIGSGEVNQDRVKVAQEFITDTALKSCSLRLLPVGTVIIGMIGQGKTRGMSAILDIEATINQNLAAILPGPKIHSMFLIYLFHAAYWWLREAGRGSNQAALNCEILSQFKIVLPPLNEQQKIVICLDHETAKIDTLVDDAQQAINLLKERRSALISAAVTGKIDVRNYTAPREVVSGAH